MLVFLSVRRFYLWQSRCKRDPKANKAMPRAVPSSKVNQITGRRTAITMRSRNCVGIRCAKRLSGLSPSDYLRLQCANIGIPILKSRNWRPSTRAIMLKNRLLQSTAGKMHISERFLRQKCCNDSHSASDISNG